MKNVLTYPSSETTEQFKTWLKCCLHNNLNSLNAYKFYCLSATLNFEIKNTCMIAV